MRAKMQILRNFEAKNIKTTQPFLVEIGVPRSRKKETFLLLYITTQMRRFLALLLLSFSGAQTLNKDIRNHAQSVYESKSSYHAYVMPDLSAKATWPLDSDCYPAMPPNRLFDFLIYDDHSSTLSRQWLHDPHDDDNMLLCRMDGMNDHFGGTRRNLMIRQQIHIGATHGIVDAAKSDDQPRSNNVLFDARCLQSEGYRDRGIGVYAKDVLQILQQLVPSENLFLLIDKNEQRLPKSLVREHPTIHHVTEDVVDMFAAFIQPSPMTHSIEPVLELLQGSSLKVAVVYDFIPMKFPAMYVPYARERIAYASALDSLLKHYDAYITISESIRVELEELMRVQRTLVRVEDQRQDAKIVTALPSLIARQLTPLISNNIRDADKNDYVIVASGMEPRKNAIAVFAAATLSSHPYTILVLGMANDKATVYAWCRAFGLPRKRVKVLDHVSEQTKSLLMSKAKLVLVPSFDEGLSIPVIEGVLASTTVIASDIPVHRELIGSGSYLVAPSNVTALAESIALHFNNAETAKQQRLFLFKQKHVRIDDALKTVLTTNDLSSRLHSTHLILGKVQNEVDERKKTSTGLQRPRSKQLSLGFATPWPPQRTGVAPSSARVVAALSKLAKVTVYVTSSAEVSSWKTHGLQFRRVDDLFRLKRNRHGHDALITVLGNSHFHLPFLQLAEKHDAYIICHDTRLADFYMALRGNEGLQAVMMKGVANTALPQSDAGSPVPLNDFSKLPNYALSEIMELAIKMFVHTPLAATSISSQVGKYPAILPFPVRFESGTTFSRINAAAKKQKLNFLNDCYHVSTFGGVDSAHKQAFDLLNATAILEERGHKICLHFVGPAPGDLAQNVAQYAQVNRISFVNITQYVSEETYLDYMAATDVGVQLRRHVFLGLSGSLSDMAALGVPAVASYGLATEIRAPGYVDRLNEKFTPTGLADAIEARILRPHSPEYIAHEKKMYLSQMSAVRYSRLLLKHVLKTARRL